jgi:hypothetical protein
MRGKPALPQTIALQLRKHGVAAAASAMGRRRRAARDHSSRNYRRSSRHADHVRGPAFRLGLVGALDAVPALGLGTI